MKADLNPEAVEDVFDMIDAEKPIDCVPGRAPKKSFRLISLFFLLVLKTYTHDYLFLSCILASGYNEAVITRLVITSLTRI